MQITSSIKSLPAPTQPKALPAPTAVGESNSAPEAPAEKVELSYDKEAAKAEGKNLWSKARGGGIIGGALGAAAGVAAGIVGGIAGTLVGLAVAPAGAVVGMVAGGVGGFMAVANRKNTHVGHLIGGLALGALGAVALGTAGFYGGAALGAAAGATGGALGAVSGLIGGTTIGSLVGGGSVASYELSANKEKYPNLLAQLKDEAAKEAEKKKLEEAEQKKFEAELKQKLKDAFKKS